MILIHLKPSACAAIRKSRYALIDLHQRSNPVEGDNKPQKTAASKAALPGVREMDIKIFLAVLIVATVLLLASYFLPPLQGCGFDFATRSASDH